MTPRALRVARNHFDCPELEGAPLEDGGGAGTGGAPAYGLSRCIARTGFGTSPNTFTVGAQLAP